MPTTIATPTWNLGALTFNTVDSNGTWWGVQSSTGWFDAPDLRLNQSAIPRYDGLYRSRSFRQGRTITLSGWVKAPTKALAVNARDKINGLLPDGGQLTLTVADDTQTRTALVELAGPPKATPAANGTEIDWQLTLSAADPRKYDINQVTASTLLASAASGLDFVTSGGLDFVTGGGLNFGTVTSTGTLTLTNVGTADTWPILTLLGSLTTPTITLTATGQQLAYAGTLASSDTVVLTSSPYIRTVILNGSTDRRPSLSTAQWFSVPPGGTVSLQLSSTNLADTGQLVGSLYPAYW